MKPTLKLIIALLLLSSTVSAQKYMTKTGQIRFFSETPVEKIEATNNQVNSAIDIATGDFVFKVLIRGFEFKKALMQEHFNENYMESDKMPTSTFTGKITNLKEINFAKDGVYKAIVEGNLTIHGVTKKITEKGTLEIKGGRISTKATINIKPKDYNIAIPGAVVANIAESIQVFIDATLDKI
jgi:YceI-like domain